MANKIWKKSVPLVVGVLVAFMVFATGLCLLRERRNLEDRSALAVLIFPDRRVEIPYEKFKSGECLEAPTNSDERFDYFINGCDGVVGSDRGDAVDAIISDISTTLPKLLLPMGVLLSVFIGMLAANKVRPSDENQNE
jgi:hypothetical protein